MQSGSGSTEFFRQIFSITSPAMDVVIPVQ
jgi:hypothetical protein